MMTNPRAIRTYKNTEGIGLSASKRPVEIGRECPMWMPVVII